MNAAQANDMASSLSTQLTSKSDDRKVDQLQNEAMQSQSDQNDSNDESDSQKPSPTNQRLLSKLKRFKIEKSKYKHYGYRSSLNSQALEKMVCEASDTTKFDSDLQEENQELKESRSKSSNRIIIDGIISQILDIPQQTSNEDSIWPYNADTLNEILKLKTEQEKTKQESIKNEFGATAVKLLRLAKSMNINGDLVPFLFISDVSVDDLKIKINKLQNDPIEVVKEITQKANDLAPEISKLNKKKSSEAKPGSSSEANESAKSPNDCFSPPKSPVKSPVTVHRRVHSEGSDSLDNELTPTIQNAQSMTSNPSYSQQHSPQLHSQLPQPNIYPVYYTTSLQNAQTSSAPPPPPSSNETSSSSVLGSPYSQKYPPMMYQTPSGHYIGGPGYLPQQSYQYYAPSPPNNGPYIIQGPPPPGLLPQLPPPHFHLSESESTRLSAGVNVNKFNQTDLDDLNSYKKQKSSTKNYSINFMITTPKNPPARKYNNPTKER